jgi:hypothetical protein
MTAMSCQGVGAVLGGFILSGGIDHFKSLRHGFLIVMCLSTAAFSSLIIFVFQNEFSFIVYVFTFCFGLMDSAVSTHLGLICGFEMQG